MIIAELYGGLGNQLFEYANAKALAIHLNQDLYFDLSFFDQYHIKNVYRLDKFNTDIKIADVNSIKKLKQKAIRPTILKAALNKIGFSGYYSQKNHFTEEWFVKNNKEILQNKKDFYVSGYYANEKYFKNTEDTIRQDFTLVNELNDENKKILQLIKETNSVGVHIRRGDYLGNNYFAKIPLCYYECSYNLIKNKILKPTFFVFSDDIAWAELNIKFGVETIYVNVNDSATDYMELVLMSSCKHNIIANSTFSWWAAWLNNNNKKVIIGPKVWYNNRIAQAKYESDSFLPSTWIKL